MNRKVNLPCYFYNTGGCYKRDGTEKTDNECKYMHVKIISPMEKPQTLKPPCKYYHLRGWCKNPDCVFGHVELNEERWYSFFKTKPYPGRYYTTYYTWSTY